MALVSRTPEAASDMETAKSLPKEIIIQIIEDYFAFRAAELKNLGSAIEERGPSSQSLTNRRYRYTAPDGPQLSQSTLISHHRRLLARSTTSANLQIRLRGRAGGSLPGHNTSQRPVHTHQLGEAPSPKMLSLHADTRYSTFGTLQRTALQPPTLHKGTCHSITGLSLRTIRNRLELEHLAQ